MSKYIYTIKKEDINKTKIILQCSACNKKEIIDINNFMGRILSCDVGKRIYKTNSGVYQVENNEQLQKRLSI